MTNDVSKISRLFKIINSFLSNYNESAAPDVEASNIKTADMEARLKKAIAIASLVNARRKLDEFENINKAYRIHQIDSFAREIHDLVTRAGVDTAALDVTGSSTAKDMDDRIEQAVIRASLISGRKELIKLETLKVTHGVGSIDNRANTIQELFQKAGNFNPEGIEARLSKAVERAYNLPQVIKFHKNRDGFSKS